jgi:hypothetical protein
VTLREELIKAVTRIYFAPSREGSMAEAMTDAVLAVLAQRGVKLP